MLLRTDDEIISMDSCFDKKCSGVLFTRTNERGQWVRYKCTKCGKWARHD